MIPKIIFVEGNIGAGKTTFLKNIKNFKKKYQIIYEPVDEWISSGMLDKFYKDPEKYAYEFQLYCLETRFKLFEKIDKNVEYVFIERSPMCDRFVFAEVCLKKQTELLSQYIKIYNQRMYIDYIQKYNYPYHYIYIKTPYEQCYKNISKRSRSQEINISKEYLSELENRHDNWLEYHTQIIINNFRYHENGKNKYIQINDLDVTNDAHIELILNKSINYIEQK